LEVRTVPRPRRIPSYRYHKASNQAVVVLDGKSHYLGEWESASSWSEYDRLIAEWLANGRRETPAAEPPPSASPTVAEILLAFWRHAHSHYRHPDGTPSEELGNLKAALRPVRQLYGLTPATAFGPLALRAVRRRMVDDGLARTSINARVNRVRRAFKWAASVELIPVSIVTALATVGGLQKGRSEARESDPVEPVALDRVEATLPHLSRPVAGLVRLQLLTGMRPGEACMMRGRDLTPGEVNWTYRPGSHKTEHHGKRRLIPLGPRAVELVREFLTTNLDAYLFSPAVSVAEFHARRSAARKSRLTPSEAAKRKASPGSKHAARYRRHTYRNAINRACDKAFPHPTLSAITTRRLTADQRDELATWRSTHRWHPNQLRHTAATEIRAKYGLEAAQVILGHSRADVTQVYAERDLAKAHDVMREIG
jgi:integrase